VLATAEQATNPEALSRLIADTGATYMMATPTLWEALVAVGWSGSPYLTAVCGGETLTASLAEALLQRCPAVWNAYGPTEATVGSNFSRLAEGDTVTVGRPLPNARVYVVDSRGLMQPVAFPGRSSSAASVWLVAISIALTSTRSGSETIHSIRGGGSFGPAIVAGSCPMADCNTWAATTTR